MKLLSNNGVNGCINTMANEEGPEILFIAPKLDNDSGINGWKPKRFTFNPAASEFVPSQNQPLLTSWNVGPQARQEESSVAYQDPYSYQRGSHPMFASEAEGASLHSYPPYSEQPFQAPEETMDSNGNDGFHHYFTPPPEWFYQSTAAAAESSGKEHEPAFLYQQPDSKEPVTVQEENRKTVQPQVVPMVPLKCTPLYGLIGYETQLGVLIPASSIPATILNCMPASIPPHPYVPIMPMQIPVQVTQSLQQQQPVPVQMTQPVQQQQAIPVTSLHSVPIVSQAQQQQAPFAQSANMSSSAPSVASLRPGSCVNVFVPNNTFGNNSYVKTYPSLIPTIPTRQSSPWVQSHVNFV